MKKERSRDGGFSSIGVTAVLSVFMLIAVAGWQMYQSIQENTRATSYVATDATKNAEAKPVTQTAIAPFSPIESELGSSIFDELVSKYLTLQEQGTYTKSAGERVAEQMAETLNPIVQHNTYKASDIATDPDERPDRSLSYRRDLQDSLKHLLKVTQPEFETFAYYVETRDEKYLSLLAEAAQNYRTAASESARIVVPRDALDEHLALLNALEQFAATLDAMTANAEDPFASVALLRTYNDAEASVFLSFDALATYYKQKSV